MAIFIECAIGSGAGKSTYPELDGNQAEWGAPDLEGLTTGGGWRQTIFHRNGLPASGTGFDRLFPETTRIVSEILDFAGGGLPKGGNLHLKQ